MSQFYPNCVWIMSRLCPDLTMRGFWIMSVWSSVWVWIKLWQHLIWILSNLNSCPQCLNVFWILFIPFSTPPKSRLLVNNFNVCRISVEIVCLQNKCRTSSVWHLTRAAAYLCSLYCQQQSKPLSPQQAGLLQHSSWDTSLRKCAIVTGSVTQKLDTYYRSCPVSKVIMQQYPALVSSGYWAIISSAWSEPEMVFKTGSRTKPDAVRDWFGMWLGC